MLDFFQNVAISVSGTLCEINHQHLQQGSAEEARSSLSFGEIKYFCFLERVILYFVFY